MLLNTSLVLTEDTETSKTYKVSEDKIQGSLDGIQALQQWISKLLSTQMYDYEIYSFEYGVDLQSLIGKDRIFVEIEAKRRIKEALMKDDRITDVSNFVSSFSGDAMLLIFNVVSIYGTIKTETEVAV